MLGGSLAITPTAFAQGGVDSASETPNSAPSTSPTSRPRTSPPPSATPQAPPAPSEAARPDSGQSSSGGNRGSGGFDIPDVSNWTIADAMEYLASNQLVALAIVSFLVLAILWVGNLIGPGSTNKLKGRDVKPLPGIIWLFPGLLVFLSMPLALEFVRTMPQLQGADSLKRTALETLGAVGAGVITGFVMYFVIGKTAPNAGLKIKASDALIGLGAFALVLPLTMLAGVGGIELYKSIHDGAAPPLLAHPTLEIIINNKDNHWAWLLAALAVLATPFVEEVVYRGFLQSSVLRFLNGQVWLAILVTSVLFTMVHRAGPNPVPWHALLPIFVLGVSMGVAFERTKRLGVPIVMHICFNGFNVAFAYASH